MKHFALGRLPVGQMNKTEQRYAGVLEALKRHVRDLERENKRLLTQLELAEDWRTKQEQQLEKIR